MLFNDRHASRGSRVNNYKFKPNLKFGIHTPPNAWILLSTGRNGDWHCKLGIIDPSIPHSVNGLVAK